MAPLCDVAPAYLLNRVFQSFGHVVDGTARLRYLTAEHLVREAATWGAAGRVAETVASVATRVRAALPEVMADGIDVGPVAEQVDARAAAAITAAEGCVAG